MARVERLRESEATRRVGLAVLLAVTLVGVAVVLPGGAGGSGGSGGSVTLAVATEQEKSAAGVPHDDSGLDPHDHDHSDPATKNHISRGLAADGQVVEPVSAAARSASEEYVERERALPDPTLVKVPAYPARAAVPGDRCAMAGGCYTLQTGSGAYVTRTGTALAVAAVPRTSAATFYFKATRLGGYLLHTQAGEVSLKPDGTITVAAEPGPQADWTATKVAEGYTFQIATSTRSSVARARASTGW